MFPRGHLTMPTPVAQVVKNPPANARNTGSIPELGRSPGQGVFLLGKFHGLRSMTGYCLWGCKELDTAERPCSHAYADIFVRHTEAGGGYWHPVDRNQGCC